jgi:hypothetical protein
VRSAPALLLLAGCGAPRLAFPTCTDVGDDLLVGATPAWDDVRPVLERHCVACHQDGGVAPFSMRDLDEVVRWAPAMRTAVVARTMPPPGPTSCGECNRFTNARWLEPLEIATIRAWADAGAPLGDDPAPVAAPEPAAALDRVDLVVEMDEPYTPDASAPSDYRCFVIPAVSDVDGYLTGWEGRPGDAREVHHVILYALPTGAEVQARALDAATPGPGYTCFGGPGVDGEFAGGWAPGMGATPLPAGTGVKLPAGGWFVMQVHYDTAQGAFPDTTGLALRVDPTVNAEAKFVLYSKGDFRLPPGEAEVRVEQTWPVLYPPYLDTVTIWGVLPHLHTLGRELSVEIWGHGEPTCVVDAVPWDFHAQGLYLYDEPLVVRGDDHLRLTCAYDTRSRTTTTFPGEGTADEMCVVFLYGTAGAPDAARSPAGG